MEWQNATPVNDAPRWQSAKIVDDEGDEVEQKTFHFLTREGEQIKTTIATPKWQSAKAVNPEPSLDTTLLAPAESALTIASGLVGSAVGGLTGIAVGLGNLPLKGDAEGRSINERLFGTNIDAAGVIGDIQEDMTYGRGWGRQTIEAEKLLSIVNYPLEKWSEHVAHKAGSALADAGAWPSVAAGVETALEFAPWLVLPAAYRAGRYSKQSKITDIVNQETFDVRLKESGLSAKDIKEARSEWIELAETGPGGKPLTEANIPLAGTIESMKSIVAPIGTGSPRAQAIVKNYVNEMRLIDVRRNNALKEMEKRFKRSDFNKMGEAWQADELALVEGRTPTAIDSLPLNQRNSIRALQAIHDFTASEAMQTGVIPVSREGYFPRIIVRQLGMDTAKRVYGNRAIQVATKHAKKRKYKTVEETEAAAMKLLGEDARVSRDVRQIILLDAELQRAIHGKKLIQEIRKFGTELGEEAVKYWDGRDTPGYFRIDNPAFVDVRPEFKPRADVGPRGGKTKARKDEEGQIVWKRKPLQISKEFEGPLRAALETTPNKVYRGIMRVKMAQMLAIMVSPLMHGQVIWGKALPFQPFRTLSFKNYRDGHRIENITKGDQAGLAKKAENNTWVRDKSNGEFQTTEALISQAIRDGHAPIGDMGWYQRVSDVMSIPKLEAGRSVVSKIVGVPFKLISKGAQQKAMRTVDIAGHFWHDKLLWDQVRAMGYGLYFNLRQKMIKRGVDKELAGKTAAHLANRFTGSIPFEDMSAGLRATMNAMLFSKSFTGTNVGLYVDAVRGLPRAVQSQLIESGATLQGAGQANSQLRLAAGATLMKDILAMYLLNSMFQNAVKIWQDSIDVEWDGLVDGIGGEKFVNVDTFAMKASVDSVIQEYLNGLDRYEDPATSFFDVEELTVNATNDPDKRKRVFIGTLPDGTAEYIRIPFGKVGEDLEKAITSPVELAWNKLSPVMGFTMGLVLGDKSKQRGYGIEVYDPDGSTIKAAGDIILYFLETSYADDYAETIVNAAFGDEKDKDAWKAVMMTAGFSFSKGAPGGPARGTIFAEEERRQRAMRRHAPKARELIRKGEHEAAAELMINKALMSPDEAVQFIRRKVMPMMTERQIIEFHMHASSLDKMRLEHQMEARRERSE